jgi:hypothetical protein
MRRVLNRCCPCVTPVPFEGRLESLGTALSLRKPEASSATILRDKLDAGFLKRSYEGLSRFGPTTDVPLGSLQSFDRRRGYPGVRGQVILGPAEQSSRRFDLTN